MRSLLNKLFLVSFITFVSCVSSSKTKVVVELYQQDQPVIIRLSKKYNKIFGIKLPVGIKLTNKSSSECEFTTIKYRYGENNGVTEFVYKYQNDNLIGVKNNSKKTINPKKNNSYLIYSSHKLDSSSLIQEQFKSYIQKMKKENIETLDIGTIKQFKLQHAKLLQSLTKEDSISVQLLLDDKLGERIQIPVKW